MADKLDLDPRIEVAKTVGYALVKQAARKFPVEEIVVCSKMVKGGAMKVWIEIGGKPAKDLELAVS